MRCPLCGCRFSEDEGVAACRGCPLSRSCQMVRCPNCGYDVPLEPGLMKLLKKLRRQIYGNGREG